MARLDGSRANAELGDASGQSDRVAVLQETSVGGEFEERPEALRLGPRDRAGREKVAGADMSAVAGGMGELLAHRPVEVRGVGAGDDLVIDRDGQSQVETAPGWREVIQGRRIL